MFKYAIAALILLNELILKINATFNNMNSIFYSNLSSNYNNK